MQDYLPLITGSGGCLVVLAIWVWAMATGKIHSDAEFQAVVHDRDDYKAALETERTTNGELARAGGVAAKALDALVEVATGRHEHDQADQHRAHGGRELTAGDLGL